MVIVLRNSCLYYLCCRHQFVLVLYYFTESHSNLRMTGDNCFAMHERCPHLQFRLTQLADCIPLSMRMHCRNVWRTARFQKSLVASVVAKREIEASRDRRAALARGTSTSWPWSPRQYYPCCCVSALYQLSRCKSHIHYLLRYESPVLWLLRHFLLSVPRVHYLSCYNLLLLMCVVCTTSPVIFREPYISQFASQQGRKFSFLLVKFLSKYICNMCML
jgi:hypothetical protein